MRSGTASVLFSRSADRKGPASVLIAARTAALLIAASAVPASRSQQVMQPQPSTTVTASESKGGQGQTSLIELAPINATKDAAAVLRAVLEAGLGREVLQMLTDIAPEAQTPLARASLDDAIAQLAFGLTFPERATESQGADADKLRGAMVRGEQLLATGNVQAAFRLLDDVAGRARDAGIVLMQSERLVAHAALRAGREGAARQACLRAVRSGQLTQEDAPPMLWLAAGEATLDANARVLLLSRAKQAANTMTASPAHDALRVAIANELSQLLQQLGAAGAANGLAPRAVEASKIGNADTFGNVWYSEPLDLAISGVRAQPSNVSDIEVDTLMLRGDVPGARVAATKRASAVEPGSADSWAAMCRLVACEVAAGDVGSATSRLLNELAMHRTPQGERAWLIARAIVDVAARQDPPRAAGMRSAITREAMQRAEVLQKKMQSNEQFAASDLWHSLQLELVQIAVDGGVGSTQANANQGQRIAQAARELYKQFGEEQGQEVSLAGSTTMHVLVAQPAMRAACEIAAAVPSPELTSNLAQVLGSLLVLAPSNAREAARLLSQTTGDDASLTWAQKRVWFVPQTGDVSPDEVTATATNLLQAAVLLQLGKASDAVSIPRGDGQTKITQVSIANLHSHAKQLALRCALRLENIELIEQLADELMASRPELLIPLLRDGWFELALVARGKSSLRELMPPPYAAEFASLLSETDSVAQRTRRDAVERNRARASTLRDEVQRLDVLAGVAAGGSKADVSKQAASLLERELTMVRLAQSPPRDGDPAIAQAIEQAVVLAKGRQFAKARDLVQMRLRVASVAVPKVDREKLVPQAWKDRTDELVRACDPRVVVSLAPEEVQAARDLTARAILQKDPPLCHRAIALQLSVLAGDVLNKSLVDQCMDVVRGRRMINTQLLAAVDEALAMRGDTRSRIELAKEAVFVDAVMGEQFANEVIVRIARWGTMDDVNKLMAQLNDSKTLKRFVSGLALGEVGGQLTGDSERRAQVLYEIGGVAHREIRDQFAMELYREALKIDPENAWNANNLAYLMLERGGDIVEAERLLELAFAQLSHRASIVDSVGWLRYKQGLIEDFERNGVQRGGAVSQLKHALKMLEREGNADGNAEITAHLGDALWQRSKVRTGAPAALDRAEAVRYWSMGLATAQQDVKTAMFVLDRNPGLAAAYLQAARTMVAGLEARLRVAGPNGGGVNGLLDAAAMEAVIEPMGISPVFVARQELPAVDSQPVRKAAEGDPCSRFVEQQDMEMFEP